MNRRLCMQLTCIVSCMLLFISAHAQKEIYDLLKGYKNAKDDSNKVSYALKIIHDLPHSDTAEIRYYTDVAFRIVNEIGLNNYLAATVYYTKASFLHKMQEYNASKSLGEDALGIIKKIPKTLEALKLKGQITEMLVKDYQNLNQILNAQISSNDNLTLYDSIKDYEGAARVNLQLGYIFFNRQQYEKAKFYLNESIRNFRFVNPKNKYIGIQYLNLARIYDKEDSLDKMEANMKVLRELMDKAPYDIEQRADFFYLQGEYHRKIGRYAEAENFFKKGAHLARVKHLKFSYVNNLEGLADTYIATQKYSTALQVMQAYKDYVFAESFALFNYKQTALSKLNKIQELMGNIPIAYNYMKEYVNYTDSIASFELTQHIYSLEAQYQSVAKEKKINELQFEKDRTELMLKVNFLIILIITILLILGAILLNLFYKNYNKQIQITEQNTKLFELETDRMKQELEVEKLAALEKGSENALARVGTELHDSLGGSLSALKMNLESEITKLKRSGVEVQCLETLSGRLGQINDEMRFISHSLSPKVFEMFGLVQALNEYISHFGNANGAELQLHFESIDYVSVNNFKVEMALYRLSQEFVHNAVKHANAKNILVQLYQEGDYTYLTIEDDGDGFNIEKVKANSGIGLYNAEVRVNYVQGTMTIDSKEGVGTTIDIRVPTNG